jgi:hypothetical protein
MGSFSVIVSSGHAGTTWLATVLDDQPGESWHQHFREEMTDKPWEVLDLLKPTDKIFDQYWRWMRGEINVGNTGDANSWPPHLILEVNKVLPIDRVVYLTRNGVQQLNSLITTSPALKKDPLPVAAEDKLLALYKIAPDVPDKLYAEWTRHERLCLMIAANDFMPDYLRGHGLTVDIYNLEDLITDLDTLRELAPGLDDATLEKWQQTDINRKTEGGRAPSTIWRKWSAEQRRAYRDIVGSPEL